MADEREDAYNAAARVMAEREELQANPEVWARFYRDGKTLGEIAEEFGCSIYRLSPWLNAPLVRATIRLPPNYQDIKTACEITSVNWTLSGDQVLRLYQQVNETLVTHFPRT